MKKEKYFSNDNRGILDELYTSLNNAPGKRDFSLKKDSLALLVLDMQDYFLDDASHAYVPDSAYILPKINNLQKIFRDNNLPVFQTRHINEYGKSGMMEKWWKDLIMESSPLSRITTELQDKNIPVIQKNQYDAFYNTDLQMRLKEKRINQVVIGGIMTHLCCETTARSAFTLGFEVIFLIDGTATYNLDFHRATLLNIAHGFGICITVKEVISQLSKQGER